MVQSPVKVAVFVTEAAGTVVAGAVVPGAVVTGGCVVAGGCVVPVGSVIGGPSEMANLAKPTGGTNGKSNVGLPTA